MKARSAGLSRQASRRALAIGQSLLMTRGGSSAITRRTCELRTPRATRAPMDSPSSTTGRSARRKSGSVYSGWRRRRIQRFAPQALGQLREFGGDLGIAQRLVIDGQVMRGDVAAAARDGAFQVRALADLQAPPPRGFG